MSNKTVNQLLAERQRLLSRISDLGDALHGSIVERYSTCSRPTCRCHQGEKHGPRYYLAVNEAGRQRQKYIRDADLERARQGVAHYHQLQKLLDQLTHTNLAILRETDGTVV